MSKLLNQVSDQIRIRHYSYRTEKTYKHWIKQYILFHNKTHPNSYVHNFLYFKKRGHSFFLNLF